MSAPAPAPLHAPQPAGLHRRWLPRRRQAQRWLAAAALAWLALWPGLPAHAAMPLDGDFEGDPFKSLQWPGLKSEFLGPGARVLFDSRVSVQGPAFAEDPMNVPITVLADLPEVRRVLVLVDRNPIRRVLELQPLAARAAVSFRFKLEQASPVRALAQTADGLWHVGGAWVDSAGGGCTVAGGSRADGSWSQTLGQVSARVYAGTGGSAADAERAARLRLRIMHPMDTGLVNGIPAFYLSRLSVLDARDRELLRMQTFEPVSENPVFSFDFAERPATPLRIEGRDNNGNRINTRIE